jgi:hypothetical protein
MLDRHMGDVWIVRVAYPETAKRATEVAGAIWQAGGILKAGHREG